MLCCGLWSSNWVTRMATFPSQNPSSKPLPHTANGRSQRQLKELIKQWSEGFICLVQFVCWILESDAVLPLPNFNLFLTSFFSKNGNLPLQQNPNALSPNQAKRGNGKKTLKAWRWEVKLPLGAWGYSEMYLDAHTKPRPRSRPRLRQCRLIVVGTTSTVRQTPKGRAVMRLKSKWS